MYHKGINREIIIEKAIEIVKEKGVEQFSLHTLASQLGVKTASLYTHIDNLNDVLSEVIKYSIHLQCQYELQNIGDLTLDQAVFALADGWRRFALENKELYQINTSSPLLYGLTREQVNVLWKPVEAVLQAYPLTHQEYVHWQRILRSVMHGFVVQEQSGYFSYFKSQKEESYHLAIQCFLDGLHCYIDNKADHQ